VPAAHAYYLARGRFAAFKTPGRVPKSWTEVVNDAAEPFRFACIVHGGLRAYDWTDLVNDASASMIEKTTTPGLAGETKEKEK